MQLIEYSSSKQTRGELLDSLKNTLPDHSRAVIHSLATMMKEASSVDDLAYEVRTPNHSITLRPTNKIGEVSCQERIQ